MSKDLTNSNHHRQNILNNKYAIEQLQEALGIRGFEFEGKICFTKKQVAEFYDIDERTIERYLEKYEQELRRNGYEILRGERLRKAKKHFDTDIDVGIKTGRRQSLQLTNCTRRCTIGTSPLREKSRRPRVSGPGFLLFPNKM